MKKTLLLFATSLLLMAPVVKAQTTTPPASAPASAPAPAASAAPAAPTASPAQRKAAEELLQTIQAEKTLQNTVDQMLNMQLSQRPEMKAVEPEMRAFMGKYMSWASLKGDMVNLYASEFSEKELKDLSKFYKTPLGQKLLSKQGVLSQASLELGQRNLQAHLPELQQTIQTKMQGQAPANSPVK
jgi:hypothetical protein